MVLGASIAHLTLAPVIGRRAILLGAALGTLPDLDVLVPYDDAIASFTYHRSWSHSLFVLSIISIPIAWLCKKLLGTATTRYSTWLIGVWLILITHPLLDGFTLYGTQIWWPLTPTPTAWGSVFIIDPLYTFPLLAGVIAALRWRYERARTFVLMGLSLSTLYLGWTLYAQHTTRAKVNAIIAQRGIAAEHTLIAPFPLSLLWRVVVVTEHTYLEGYSSLLDATDSIALDQYSNGKSECSEWLDHWPVQRIDWFTKGTYSLSVQGEQLVASDLRMGVEDSYVFEFDIANWQDNAWQKITTQQRPLNIDINRMKLLFHRIYDENISLTPLVPPGITSANAASASGNINSANCLPDTASL